MSTRPNSASQALKAILGPRSAARPAIEAVLQTIGSGVGITDREGKLLLGQASAPPQELTEDDSGLPVPGIPVQIDDAALGFVTGPSEAAATVALLLTQLTVREIESRALASEVLHLYREVHLIEQLSEQLAGLLNLSALSNSVLAQAQKLIHASHGQILLKEKADSPLAEVAAFCELPDQTSSRGPLSAESRFVASVLERGVAEVVNNCASDPRALPSEQELKALVCAPLRSGQRTVGVIALATTGEGASYSAADLKLLNTIALQAAAAIVNSLLCAEMVEAARIRAAMAAELQAATTVQQLLLQSASRPTPGFLVESVYLPASEVGGDFFFVSSAPDGSLTAIIGDVSGKGLTAAMRVAMILGVLHRETSHDPCEILSGLNNALIVQGQLGFTTACCIRIARSGDYSLANAGHIAPYVSGGEVQTPPAIPLGLIANQVYELVQGRLGADEHLVLLSDGVPEARSNKAELYGFDRLSSLTQLPAGEIARTAQSFGQEDDITVLTLALCAA